MENNPQIDVQLPPGFRFHPSDEELIVHYLRKKATKSPLPASIVADVELYKYNPWDLPKKSTFGDEEWYFFTPRDRKYPNGTRPNRMVASGYWKATGIDRPILSSCGSKVIGVKKALVFYTGRPPKGNKTGWIMQEYRLPELEVPPPNKREKSTRLDDWVLCRVWEKTGMQGKMWEERNGPPPGREPLQFLPKMDKQYDCAEEAAKQQTTPPKPSCTNETPLPTPSPEMVREYFYKECLMLPLLFGPPQENNYPSMDSVTSGLSYEGGVSSNSSNNKSAHSSVCENNFNLDYLPNEVATMIKRKLPFEFGNGAEIFNNPNKKAVHSHQKLGINVPQTAAMNNTNSTVNGMAPYNATTHTERNNNYNVEQTGPTMCQDLYNLAFT